MTEWPGASALEALSRQSYIEHQERYQHDMQPDNRYRYYQLDGTVYTLWNADPFNNYCLFDCVLQWMLHWGKDVLVLTDQTGAEYYFTTEPRCRRDELERMKSVITVMRVNNQLDVGVSRFNIADNTLSEEEKRMLEEDKKDFEKQVGANIDHALNTMKYNNEGTEDDLITISKACGLAVNVYDGNGNLLMSLGSDPKELALNLFLINGHFNLCVNKGGNHMMGGPMCEYAFPDKNVTAPEQEPGEWQHVTQTSRQSLIVRNGEDIQDIQQESNGYNFITGITWPEGFLLRGNAVFAKLLHK